MKYLCFLTLGSFAYKNNFFQIFSKNTDNLYKKRFRIILVFIERGNYAYADHKYLNLVK